MIALLAGDCALAPTLSGCKSCAGSSSEPTGAGGNSDTPQNEEQRLLRGETKRNLRSVWGSSDHDVWVVGDSGVILHFDGRAWSVVKPATLENLTGVRGLGPDQIWACSDKGTIIHWDGKTWTPVAHADKMTLLSIWASSPTDVWAGGMDSDGDSGYIYRFNGEKWVGQGIPGSASVWDVYGSGPTDVWMVGSAPSGGGLVLHGDGKKFDAVGYDGAGARSVWSPHPGETWVAPYDGTIQHWNGTAWSHISAVPGAGSLLRVAGSAPDDVWAVGLNGTTLHNRGGNWVSVPSGTTEVLWSVWARTVEDAWAVGNGGAILRWNGSSWHKG